MFFKKYNTIWAEFFTYEKCRIDYSINKKEEKNVLTIACASKIKVYCNVILNQRLESKMLQHLFESFLVNSVHLTCSHCALTFWLTGVGWDVTKKMLVFTYGYDILD